jgi:DNA recombination protein RmuC
MGPQALFIGLAVFTVGAFVGVMVASVVRRICGNCSAFHSRIQSEQLQKQLRESREQASRLEELEAERIRREATAATRESSHREQVEQLTRIQSQIGEKLDAMARQAQNDGQMLLAQAAERLFKERAHLDKTDHSRSDSAIETLIQPITDTLARFDEKLAMIADDRRLQLGAIAQHLEQVARVHADVRDETQRLANVLEASPKAFGHWGERQLHNILDLAGMLPYVDLVAVDREKTADGTQPDAILRLPAGRRLVIDANVPTAAFKKAVEASDAATEEKALAEYAGAVRQHLEKLGSDGYRQSFEVAPELVVLFLPAENLLAAALTHDPALFEDGVRRQVLMATPTTLIALAKAVAHSWEQEKSSENVRELAALGAELYDHMAQITDQIEELGRGLETSVRSYNSVVGDIQGTVMGQLRRLREMAPGSSKSDLTDPSAIDVAVRTPRRRRSFVITQAGQEAAAAITAGPEGPPVPLPARAMTAQPVFPPVTEAPPRPTAAPVDPF